MSPPKATNVTFPPAMPARPSGRVRLLRLQGRESRVTMRPFRPLVKRPSDLAA